MRAGVSGGGEKRRWSVRSKLNPWHKLRLSSLLHRTNIPTKLVFSCSLLSEFIPSLTIAILIVAEMNTFEPNIKTVGAAKPSTSE